MRNSKKFFLLAFSLFFPLITGCSSAGEKLAGGAAGKNLDISGYVMLGKVETVAPETASPLGKFIIGRLNYKSRLVAVGKDQQIPTAGSFRAVRSFSLFGNQETVIEYDFTAANAQAAASIVQALEQQRCNAEKALSE